MFGLSSSPVARGVAWGVVSASSYSLFTVFVRGILEELEPRDLVLWRFALAAPLAWLIVARRRDLRAGMPLFLPGVLFSLLAWAGFAALDRLPVAVYIVLISTYPAMVAVGGLMLRQPVRARTWWGIAVTLSGVTLLVTQRSQGPSLMLTGVILVVINAALYAIYIIWSDLRIRTGVDGLVAMTWSLTGSLAGAAVLVVPFGVQAPSSAGVWWRLLALAGVSTLLAGAAFYRSLALLGSADAALIAIADPSLGVLWSVVLLGEPLGAIQVVGAVVVMVGVAWSQWRPATGDSARGGSVTDPTLHRGGS
jgi:drug/metabolite transporter (DMT)-like permease